MLVVSIRKNHPAMNLCFLGQYDVVPSADSGLSITMDAVTTGTPNFETFSLKLNGYLSAPLTATATDAEVESAVWGLYTPQCPSDLGTNIGTTTFLFK